MIVTPVLAPACAAFTAVAPISEQQCSWHRYPPRVQIRFWSPFYDRLRRRGKPARVALVAVAGKLLIHLNQLAREVVGGPNCVLAPNLYRHQRLPRYLLPQPQRHDANQAM
jgi:hypothetical protein